MPVAPAQAGAHVSLHPPQFHEDKDMGPSLRWGDAAGYYALPVLASVNLS